ncbi:hypothetical protein [Streptomyces sp. DH37]|uniref:hypothetical protein n=1 Tax=Streptomyces sp. DH37 TaxID=3040122 RepID=UPI0024424FD9|nr:hypothetical protein [Streptomyces sp. DH37]MDG9700850.1 hypothetical protein [Streptomyces sp. DH37]
MADECIQSVYAQRFAADLENNRAEQREIDEQITRLRARLEQLRADERWLSEMRQETASATGAHQGAEDGGADGDGSADGDGGSASAPVPVEETAVPQPRQEETVGKPAATGKTTAGKTTAGRTAAKSGGRKSARKSPAKKAAAGKTAAKTAGRKPAGPSLRELAREALEHHGEPRSAAEITKELQAAHPERTLTVQLVRNALEKLVATSAAERSKQGSSVYYTSSQPSATAAPDTEGTEAPQTAEPATADA